MTATAKLTPPSEAATTDRKLACSVRDGSFVEPCDTLAENTDNISGGFGRAKGITSWSYTNMQTHKPTRTMFGIKTQAHPKGHLFNFCPFCGVKIDAPFADTGEDPQP